MLKIQSGLAVAAVVILLANVALADIIVQPGYGQPAAYSPAFQRRPSSQEEKRNEQTAPRLPEQNVHYVHAHPSIDLEPNGGRTHTLGYPTPLWASPHALPMPYNTVPKIVHPLRVTKIGGMGYVQPSFIVGDAQFPTYAVPHSRNRRSTNEKDTGDSNAVAPNPTLINMSTKRTDSKDTKLENSHLTLPNESDDTQEKRGKRIASVKSVRQSKNEDIVGPMMGLNPDKMYPGYHEYQPSVFMKTLRHAAYVPSQSHQPESEETTEQVTPQPTQQAVSTSSSGSQRISLNSFKSTAVDKSSQTKLGDNENEAVGKKGDKDNNSPTDQAMTKRANQFDSTVSVENVPIQPVKRQGMYDDSININVNSGNTMMGDMDYPSASGPSGPPFDGGMQGGDFSLQSDYFLGNARRCQGGTNDPSQRNFPDPRPHKHEPSHQHSGHQHQVVSDCHQNKQVTTAGKSAQQIPVTANPVESANACTCQPSIVPASSILPQYSLFPRTSFYYRPYRVQPLQMISPNLASCKDTKETLAKTSPLTKKQSVTQTPTARYYSLPQNYNCGSAYRSAYIMPNYVYPSPYYMGYRSNFAPRFMYQ